MKGWSKDSIVQENGLSIDNKTNKNYPVVEPGWPRQDTCDDELAQDCKHKEIIKGENEKGNKGNTCEAN